MRILHAWDNAGVGAILAKYQRRLGHKVDVVKRSGFDRFGIDAFYGTSQFDGLTAFGFMRKVVGLSGAYDVVHVHGMPKLVFLLKIRRRNKPVVLHYHGSDVRNGLNELGECIGERVADHVIVSTEDLISCVKYNRNVSYVPDPVDLEHFKGGRVTGEKWFTFYELNSFLPDFPSCIDVDLYERGVSSRDYGSMPELFRQYYGYVDIKVVNGVRLRALSNTGLQALACGLRVLDYANVVHESFDMNHKPENVVLEVSSIYNACKK